MTPNNAATSDKATTQRKVTAIYRWVADEVRYVGLEFGIHSLKPHAVREILARRFGDCKDKATLLVALLAEVGIPAQVALVRTADAGKLRDGVASLGGFGHAIAYVPSLGWWLDATVQHHQPTELPAGDVGGQALLIPRVSPSIGASASMEGLVELPDAGAEANRRTVHAFVQLTATGGAEISLTLRAHGLPAAAIRGQLRAEVSRIERVQSALTARFPGLSVTQVQAQGVTPPADEVVVQVRGRVARLLKREGRGWRWHPLLPPTPWRKRAGLAPGRTHADVAESTWWDERNLVIAPPKGWRLEAQGVGRAQAGGLGRFDVRALPLQGGRWRFSRIVARDKRVLSAASAGRLRTWLTALDVALSAALALVREERP